uniref:Uncharacterized protein n=1 Tax=Rhizophora mucronata TaxID=61149 RepID=A0A2P2PDS7_RHIMU
MLIRALIPTNLSMKLFSFLEHELYQRAMEAFHGKSIRVISICIITVL